MPVEASPLREEMKESVIWDESVREKEKGKGKKRKSLKRSVEGGKASQAGQVVCVWSRWQALQYPI